MDITTYTMILTTKLSALSFCYKDGELKNEDLLKEQVERKVLELPTPLEMLSYVFYCGANICGPFFEFSDYINYIERKGVFANIPNTIIPSIIRMINGLMCLTLNLVIGNYYWIDYCSTAEFAAMPFLNKYIYYYIAMT